MHQETLGTLAENAQRAKDQGAPLLGYLLMKRLSGGRISHANLATVAKDHGLDKAWMPAEIRDTAAFRRAWRDANRRLEGGLELVEVGEDKDSLTICLRRDVVSEATRSTPAVPEQRLVYDKRNASVAAERIGGSGDALALVQGLLVTHQEHTTQDFQGMMSRFIARCAVSIVGTSYFVPTDHGAEGQALRAVLLDPRLGASNEMELLPLHDMQGVSATLAPHAIGGLEEEIRAMEEDLKSFDMAKARESTIEARIRDFDEKRARVGLFAGVLRFKADGLLSKLDAIRATFEGAVGARPEEPPKQSAAEKKPWEASPGDFLASLGLDESAEPAPKGTADDTAGF